MSQPAEAHDDRSSMNLAHSSGPDRSSEDDDHAVQDANDTADGTPQHGSQVDADHLSFTTADMRARMTIALDDAPPTDMAALFEHKLAAEGASPKPCIVPGNALQLIDDDPSASRAHTPASVIVLDENDRPVSVHDPSSADAEHAPDARPVPRVRFRSRVRITSGLRRSKQVSGVGGLSAGSPESSASGSPSSSISAPIRWQADENAAWGPLGRRLSAYAQHNGWQKRVPSAPRPRPDRPRVPQPRAKMDERTPLIRTPRHQPYVDAGLDGGGEADDERVVEGEFDSEDEEPAEDRDLRIAALKREEEAVFGKWPWRILNRHWWWWQVEPVLCCCCADDSDFEE